MTVKINILYLKINTHTLKALKGQEAFAHAKINNLYVDDKEFEKLTEEEILSIFKRCHWVNIITDNKKIEQKIANIKKDNRYCTVYVSVKKVY